MAGRALSEQRSSWLERLPLAGGRPWLALAGTLALCLSAVGLRVAIEPLLPAGFPFLTFLPAVLLAALLFGARMGALAGAMTALFAWRFFWPQLGLAWRPGAGTAVALFGVIVALLMLLVHWMQVSTARLVAERERNVRLAETRELLFRELQHRVSNNLQVAAALLSIQKKQVSDKIACAALDEAARRLGVVGRISRELYSPSGEMRNMRQFLEPLCHDVADAVGRPGIVIAVRSREAILLRPSAAIPVALIVAEAVANAIEHGFEGRAAGTIDIALSRAADCVTVEVHDDGKGPPPGFDLATHGSLGLNIAGMLAEQLDGSFVLVRGERTTARLTLPA